MSQDYMIYPVHLVKILSILSNRSLIAATEITFVLAAF